MIKKIGLIIVLMVITNVVSAAEQEAKRIFVKTTNSDEAVRAKFAEMYRFNKDWINVKGELAVAGLCVKTYESYKKALVSKKNLDIRTYCKEFMRLSQVKNNWVSQKQFKNTEWKMPIGKIEVITPKKSADYSEVDNFSARIRLIPQLQQKNRILKQEIQTLAKTVAGLRLQKEDRVISHEDKEYLFSAVKKLTDKVATSKQAQESLPGVDDKKLSDLKAELESVVDNKVAAQSLVNQATSVAWMLAPAILLLVIGTVCFRRLSGAVSTVDGRVKTVERKLKKMDDFSLYTYEEKALAPGVLDRLAVGKYLILKLNNKDSRDELDLFIMRPNKDFFEVLGVPEEYRVCNTLGAVAKNVYRAVASNQVHQVDVSSSNAVKMTTVKKRTA